MKHLFLTIALLLANVAAFAQSNVVNLLDDINFRHQQKGLERSDVFAGSNVVRKSITLFSLKANKRDVSTYNLERIKEAFAKDASLATEQSSFSNKMKDSIICIVVFGGSISEAMSTLRGNYLDPNGVHNPVVSSIDGAAMMVESRDSLIINVYYSELFDFFSVQKQFDRITTMMEAYRAEGKATFSPVKYLQSSKMPQGGVIRNTGIHVVSGPEMKFEILAPQISEAQLQEAFGHEVNLDNMVIVPPGKDIKVFAKEMEAQHRADGKAATAAVKQQNTAARTSDSVSGNFHSPIQVDVSAVAIPSTPTGREVSQVRVISEQEYQELLKDFERNKKGVADSTYMGVGVSVGKYYEIKDSAEAKRVFDIWSDGIHALFNDANIFAVNKTDSTIFVTNNGFSMHCALELNADHSLSYMYLEAAQAGSILYIPPVGDLHKYHYSFKDQLYEQVPPEVVASMNADIAKRDAELAAQYHKESGSKGRQVAVAGKPLSADEIRRIAIESGDQRLIEQVASPDGAASAASNGAGRNTNMRANDVIFAFVNDEPAGYVTPGDLKNIETLAAHLSIHKDNIKSYSLLRDAIAICSHKNLLPADATAVAEITTNLPSWLKKRTTPEQYKIVEKLNSRYIIDFEREKMFQNPGSTPDDVEHFYKLLEGLIEEYDQQGHTGRMRLPSISRDYEKQPISITRTKKGTEIKVLVYSDAGGYDAHIIATLLVDMKSGEVLDCKYSTESHACMDVVFESDKSGTEGFAFGEGTDLQGSVVGTLSFVTPSGTKITRSVCDQYYITLRKKGKLSIHPLFVMKVKVQAACKTK